MACRHPRTHSFTLSSSLTPLRPSPPHITPHTLHFPTQARQKGEQPPDANRASEEIENVLLRKKVFDFLAGTATITWIDAPVAE